MTFPIRGIPYTKLRPIQYGFVTLRFLVLALILMCGLAAPAQSKPVSAQSPFKTLTVAQQREDLMQLRYTLEHAHPGLYRYNSRQEMDQRFAAVAHAIWVPSAISNFTAGWPPLSARSAIRHEHQAAAEIEQFFRSDARHVFPFDIRYVGDRAFVEADQRQAHHGRARLRILSIDGHPLDQITERLISELAVDGYNRQSELDRLDASFWYRYALEFGGEAGYQVQFRAPGANVVRSVLVDGIARSG